MTKAPSGGRKGKGGSNKKKAEQVRGDSLTPQMTLFCEHYVLNGRNGADAYLAAYPISASQSPQYRAEKASKLLAQVKIQAKILVLEEQLAAKLSERFDISIDRVVQEYAAIAFANPGDYYEWGYEDEVVFDKKGQPVMVVDEFGASKPMTRRVPFARFKPSAELTAVQKKAISEVGLTYSQSGKRMLAVKLANRLAAVDKLGAYLKINTQNVEITGKDGGAIESVHHVLPDLDGVDDPKAMLRAFEDFRMGRGQGTRH